MGARVNASMGRASPEGSGGVGGGGGRGGGYDLVSKECSWDLSVSHLKFLSISVAL